MFKSVLKFSYLLVAPMLIATPGQAATWKIDPAHSSATFKVKHLVVANVHGEIGKLEGKVTLDDKNIDKSTVEATLDARTITTGNADRDKHLRSPDFFNADKCPQIKFVSKSVTGTAPSLKVTGPLTMNCVTKDVTLNVDGPSAPVKVMRGELHRGLSATVTLQRKEFGMVWNKGLDGGGVVVGDDVPVTLDIELVAE